MTRGKMMLLISVVAALAAPSLWAQKERLDAREGHRPKAASNGDPVCLAGSGAAPIGYYSSTNSLFGVLPCQ